MSILIESGMHEVTGKGWHRMRCAICHDHIARVAVCGVPACRKCKTALMLGFIFGYNERNKEEKE